MCLPLDSCFGFGTPRTDDDHYHYHAPPTTPAAPASRVPQHAQRNGAGDGAGHHYNGNGGQYNGNSYPAHGARAAAGAEADRKASNDAARRGPAHAAVADETMLNLKQQPPVAWNAARPAAADAHGARGGAPHAYSSYEPAHREREDAAAPRYPAATATALHERY